MLVRALERVLAEPPAERLARWEEIAHGTLVKMIDACLPHEIAERRASRARRSEAQRLRARFRRIDR